MAANFDALLDLNLEDIKDPPVLPVGTYLLAVATYETVESSKKGTPGVLFHYTAISPGDDIPEAERTPEFFEAVSKAKLRDTFWLSPDALPRLKRFLVQNFGIQDTGSLKQALAEIQGKQVMGHVTQVPSDKDPNRLFNQIADYAPAQ